jgi:hypothetical protein
MLGWISADSRQKDNWILAKQNAPPGFPAQCWGVGHGFTAKMISKMDSAGLGLSRSIPALRIGASLRSESRS